MDRMGTHSYVVNERHTLLTKTYFRIIRAALNLPLKDLQSCPQLLSRTNPGPSRFEHSVILDAEMVAYSEKEGMIDGNLLPVSTFALF